MASTGMEVYRYAIKDMEELLEDYSLTGQTTMDSFKQLWKQRRFTFIFDGCPPHVRHQEYVQVLYSTCLGLLSPSRGGISMRCGALHALYCLYYVQPYKQKVLVYLSLEHARLLSEAGRTIIEHGIGEAIANLNVMLKEKAFLFGAQSVDASASLAEIVKREVETQKRVALMQEKLLAIAPDSLREKLKDGNFCLDAFETWAHSFLQQPITDAAATAFLAELERTGPRKKHVVSRQKKMGKRPEGSVQPSVGGSSEDELAARSNASESEDYDEEEDEEDWDELVQEVENIGVGNNDDEQDDDEGSQDDDV